MNHDSFNNQHMEIVQENEVKVSDLILPLFLIDGKNKKTQINSMPGIYRLSKDLSFIFLIIVLSSITRQ